MRYGAEAKLTAEQVLDRAREFFGPGGEVGLAEVTSEAGSVTFGDQTGFVNVMAVNTDGHAEVTILTREYDYWVRQFVAEL